VAKKPNRPSSIDRLLPDIKELIGRLRCNGRTIDEIRAKLLELDVDVSRSALGRHVRSLADAQVMMQRSRDIAVALVDRFGAEPDDKMARLNIELTHGLVMRLLLATEPDPETGESQPVTLSAEDTMFVARTIQALSSAAKTTDDRIEKAVARAKEKATKEAAENAVKAAKAKGLSKETVESIRFAVLGSDT
jgi:hypothetical protein